MNELITSDYQGHTIQFNTAGWFNATAVAAHFGKRPVDWLTSVDAKTYITVLADILKCDESSLLKTRRGKNGGTWMHPKLGVAFARWLDPAFAVWCDVQIESIIHGDQNAIDWKRQRHAASSSNKLLNGVLQSVRSTQNKDTKFFHYANEAKLVNWALKGEFKSLDRNQLSLEELDTLAKLETQNSILLANNIDRDKRKTLLTELAKSKSYAQLT